MPWHCTVTDEGSPPKAGLTAVRTLAILRLAAEPPRLPLRRELSSLSAFKGLTEGEIHKIRAEEESAGVHKII